MEDALTKGSDSSRGEPAAGCRVEIRIEAQGDVHVHACSCHDKPPAPPAPDCAPRPPRVEGACIPLGLGQKPKQSRATKLKTLRARGGPPSALGAAFLQTGRRFLAGAAPANDFETAVYPAFRRMSAETRGVLACCVDSYESTPPDLRDAGLAPAILADPAKPVETATLTALFLEEVRIGAVQTAFGDRAALEERPGLNRFFDPGATETFESQLRICTVNGLRVSTFRPRIPNGGYLPSEIQQSCVVTVAADGTTRQTCAVQTANCPGNQLADGSCARVPEVANGDSVMLTGANFMSVDMKVRLRALTGAATAEVDAFVFGDLLTPRQEQVNGQTVMIQDCRVKDRASFSVPDDLPPGAYEIVAALPNTLGFPAFGPILFSNPEYIEVVPPPTARFQVVAERLRARRETSPQSFGSDEVSLNLFATELLADGVGAPQALKLRFGDVDSGESRTIGQSVYTQSRPAVGMALTVVGFEVDSESAFRDQLTSFEDAFTEYLALAWDKLKEALIAGAGGAIKALGVFKGAIAIAIAAVVAVAIIAVVARWAPADLIMDDAIGFSVVDLADLTDAASPSPLITHHTSPLGLGVNVTPLEKSALTYREFREYVADEEDSRYEIYLRYNRTA